MAFSAPTGYTGAVAELSGLSSLSPITAPVVERFTASGFRIFLVGGVVRDLALAGSDSFDPTANDIDLTTDALPADIKRLVSPVAEAVWAQGERFGTIGARIGGHAMEITTHRAEAYDPDSRKPIVTYGRDLHQDLSRRDFTINAAAIELPGGELHDPHHGLEDLEAKVLRTPLSPEVSFTDDPLRMMRAARFIARFALVPAPELTAATVEYAERLDIVSAERVAEELERLLAVTSPGPGLTFLSETGLLSHIVDGLDSPEQRSLAVALAAADADVTVEVDVRRAGLLWPVRDEAKTLLSNLRYSKADMSRTQKLLRGVARGTAGDIDHATVRRIAASVGPEGLTAVSQLAGLVAANDPAVTDAAADSLIELITELSDAGDLTDLGSPLTAAQIMNLLDLAPGPDVGKAQRFLGEYRLQHGPVSVDQAAEALRSWWKHGGNNDEPGTRNG